jgi:hypothetical protein
MNAKKNVGEAIVAADRISVLFKESDELHGICLLVRSVVCGC